MRNLFSLLFLLAMGLSVVSCGPSKSSEQSSDEEAMEQEDTMAAEEAAPAQDQSRPSPAREAMGTIGSANITIKYSSPSMRGRTIWGELVPYGQVWRTGANEATTFEVSKDVMIEGKALKAGKYGLFTIPTTGKWTVIFNTVPDQWGSNNYDAGKDALRVEVTPRTLDQPVEAMEFVIENGEVVLRWEKLAVPFKVAG